MDTCQCQHASHTRDDLYLPLAIAMIPVQPWDQPYEPSAALKNGTIFPNLHFPFFIGGEKHD